MSIYVKKMLTGSTFSFHFRRKKTEPRPSTIGNMYRKMWEIRTRIFEICERSDIYRDRHRDRLIVVLLIPPANEVNITTITIYFVSYNIRIDATDSRYSNRYF